MPNFLKNLFTKRNLIIVVIIAALFGFLFVLNYGLEKFNQRKQWQEIKKTAEAFKKAEEDLYQKMMADTYGGKTPEETLNMYIAAVEKGDYELASRYLIESGRKNEFEALSALKEKNNLNLYLNILKKAEPEGEVAGDTFRMKSKTKEGPYYFVRFIKYPNSIWKIQEI